MGSQKLQDEEIRPGECEEGRFIQTSSMLIEWATGQLGRSVRIVTEAFRARGRFLEE
jgi:hypothetical protein